MLSKALSAFSLRLHTQYGYDKMSHWITLLSDCNPSEIRPVWAMRSGIFVYLSTSSYRPNDHNVVLETKNFKTSWNDPSIPSDRDSM